MKYPHVAARLFNAPLLIHPGKLDAILAGLGGRILGVPDSAIAHVAAQLDSAGAVPELFTTRRGERRGDNDRGTRYTMHDGVGVVTVMGALAHRARLDADSTYILGYEEVARNLEAAVDDTDAHDVVLLLDTPGGESSGVFELAARVRELASRKPITAMVDSMAASAGYAIAAGATEIVSTPTGYAGSIGVVMRHVDFSRALANEGITVTHIFAGDHKMDGNPYEALPESVRADFQAEIDNIYTLFVDHVAAARDLTAEHVRGTQARIFQARAAVDARLVDRIATTDQVISELQGRRPRSYSVGRPARATVSKGAHAMSDTQHRAGEEQQPAVTHYTQTDLDGARAEGAAAGRQAEAERVAGILAYADEHSRSLSVAHTCIRQGLSVEQSQAVLDAAPAAVALDGLPSLAMAGGHDLGPDGGDGHTLDDRKAAQSAVAAYYGRNQ